MNIERANQIISSATTTNVTFNGTPVYIESINIDGETANVHFFNSPKKSRQVSLNSLQEHIKK